VIRIYPSLLPGEPIETHNVTARTTVADWMGANVKGFDLDRDYHPLAVEIEGEYIPAGEWQTAAIAPDTAVDIRIMPQRSAVRSVTRAISSVVSAVVDVVSSIFSFLSPSIPGTRTQTTEQGSSIYNPSAQANTPRLGGVIPEIAGRHKVFPDYLNPPRRYFVDESTQALDVMLCVGIGEYDREPDELRVGATPVNRLGSTVNFEFFEPGQTVSGNPAHRCWYSAPEVGASTGASGIRLLSTRDLEQEWDAYLALSGTTIEGDNQPQGWGEGTIVRVSFDLPITVGTNSNGDNTFEMEIDYLMPTVGLDLRVIGISGLNRVRIASVSGGVYTLERQKLVATDPDIYDWRVIDDIATGSYTAQVYRWADYSISCRVTDDSDGLDVVMQIDGSDVSGWPGFPSGTGNVTAEIDAAQLTGIWSNVFLACPPGEVTSLIEWDIFAPQGLGYVKDNGDLESRSRTVELQYRAAGTTTWTTVSRSISGRTRDQLGYTFQVNLPSPITPEVRVRRVEAEDNDTRSMDRIEWLRLKSELPAASRYPGATTLAMTIQGSNAIANQTENRISCVVTRKLGGVPTRSIADWLRYVAEDGGWSAAEIDEDELGRLEGIWQRRGDWFDFVHDDESTLKETLRRALRAGFAELTINDGLLTPVRDEPRSEIEHMYTPQNMLDDGLQRQVTMLRPDDVDGVDVEYFDAETWTTEMVECRLPGDAGIRAEQIRLEGVTDRTRAWRIGMRERRQLRYRRWWYQFATELDALNSNYLSFCALSDDVPGYGQSALITDVITASPQFGATIVAGTDGTFAGYSDGQAAGELGSKQGSAIPGREVVAIISIDAGDQVVLQLVVDPGPQLSDALSIDDNDYAFGDASYQFLSGFDVYTWLGLSPSAMLVEGQSYSVSVGEPEPLEPSDIITLELSEPAPEGATVLAWRRPNGTLSGPWPIKANGGFLVTVQSPEMPVINWSQELPHALMGTTERWSFPVLITSIEPQGFDEVRVQAANYDERIYADDDSGPPA